LVVDYGPQQSGTGDTLQAVERHVYSDPWENPGERDLTAHVDFHALGEAARRQGVHVSALTTQGEWLREMGIEARSAALAKAAPERAHEIAAARARLVAHDQMGTLFKVMAVVAPGWPEPVGFA
jgi:SAM-dependent MidA family methyltransferase